MKPMIYTVQIQTTGPLALEAIHAALKIDGVSNVEITNYRVKPTPRAK
jgi:hypothetical protein